MTADLSSVFADPKFLLGLMTIIMYAKDKFNLPTYDRGAMGPFAQLAPEFLTVDSRYRKGRMIYLLSIIFLYTALCIVGPTTLKSLDLAPQLADTAVDAFPAAAAAFLISTAAANDSTWLGKIEHFIRQYAHKAAYIPSAVSDLAFGLRSFRIDQWLTRGTVVDDKELNEKEQREKELKEKEMKERRSAIENLAGARAFAQFHENPTQEGEIAAWIRTSILLHVLEQLFTQRKLLTNSKLDHLIDLAENRESFGRIKADHAALAAKIPPQDDVRPALEQMYVDVQRLLRTISLTLAVLMSRAARSETFLNVHLEQLGFRGGYLRDRSDHFVYMAMVHAFIVLGGVAAVTCLGIATLILYKPFERANVFFPILVSAGTGILSYAVLFGVLDYLRDKALESLDWHENLEGYVPTVLLCSVIGTVGCSVLIILAFTLFGLQGLLGGSVAIVQLVLFQLIVVSLGAAFGVRYARNAARLPFKRLSFADPAVWGTPIAHGLCAAILVGGLNFAVDQYNLDREIRVNAEAVKTRVKELRQSQKETSAKSGWFSAKEPRDIEELLDKVEKAVTTVTAYASRPHIPPNFARDEQRKAVEAACGSLHKYVVRKEGDDWKNYFSNPANCELAADVVAVDAGDKIFVELANRMMRLANALARPMEFDADARIALINASVTALLFALTFGIGFTYWRAWWLHNERGLEAGLADQLEEQVRQAYGADVDFASWLTKPVASINAITPLEALRYEDYRGKLFSDVQKAPENARKLRPERKADTADADATSPQAT